MGLQAEGRVRSRDSYVCLYVYLLVPVATAASSRSCSLLWPILAPEVRQSVTPTTVRGVLAMLQDYIQLSEGKKAHGHTHNDNTLTSILPSLSHHQGGRVRCRQKHTRVQIGA